MATDTLLFTAESVWWIIPNVHLRDGSLVTGALNTPDTFTWALKNRAQTVLDSGDMTHSATVDGTWEVEIALPATKGGVWLTADATKGARTLRHWERFIEVRGQTGG